MTSTITLAIQSAALSELVAEAKAWLADQSVPTPGSDMWYSLGNFRAFIEAIDAQLTLSTIEKAIHVLRRHISDQMEWSADYCKSISAFCNRADRICRELRNG